MQRLCVSTFSLCLLAAIIAVGTAGCLFWFGISDSRGATVDSPYPRLANYFLKTPITEAEATELARWDIVVLGMQAQTVSPDQMRRIRQLNPQVKILAYVASQEFPGHYEQIEAADGLWHRLLSGIDSNWWLFRPDGSNFSSWPGNRSINVTNMVPTNRQGQRWNTYLPQFMHDQVMSSGLWDGIFYDNAWGSVAWVGDGQMDINRDGIKDNAAWLNQQWHDGMATMLAASRRLEGSSVLILGNGTNDYQESLNGRLLENAYRDGWTGDQKQYFGVMQQGRDPRVTIINRSTLNTGQSADYRSVRYGLASTLLQDGYYAYDWGDQSHAQLWWYDEYDAALGQPTGSPCRVTINNRTASGCQFNTAAPEGLWRRDFEHGSVFINSTTSDTAVLFNNEEFEKLRGSQDSVTNSGQRINVVQLASRDGLVVYRPLTEILNSAFINGQFARIFNAVGMSERSGFFASRPQFAAGSQLLTTDLNSDGTLETLAASKSAVTISNTSGKVITTFWPYGTSYNKGINLAVGDLNGDGTREIITGTELGGGPHIRVFNAEGKLINPGFFAYGKEYRGGVNVAVGDLNGDGTAEIVAGAGVGGGPHVRIFNRDGKLLSAGWFAYDQKFRGGVNVAVGDITGDGKADIITAPGNGAVAEIKIWNDKGQQQGVSWLAFDASNRGGAEVAVTDLTGDGLADIIATSLNVF